MPRIADPSARGRILSTAGRLFYDHGIQSVGMAQIVEEAGCGKNVLYRHFPSKSDLVVAYLNAFAEAQDRRADAAVAELAGDPAGALIELTRVIARQASVPGFKGCAVRDYLREFRRHDDEPGRAAMSLMARWRARVEALVGQLDAADPALLAEEIWLVQEGLYATGSRHESRAAGDAAVALVESLIAGAVSRS
jgi:AcrR family transcriptional regulator